MKLKQKKYNLSEITTSKTIDSNLNLKFNSEETISNYTFNKSTTIPTSQPALPTNTIPLNNYTILSTNYNTYNFNISNSSLINGSKIDTKTNFVEWIGGPSNGASIININISTSGTYNLSIQYIADDENRPLKIDINGVSTGVIYTLPPTKGWSISDTRTFTLTTNLNSGNNIIKLYGDELKYAPDLGMLTLVLNSSYKTNLNLQPFSSYWHPESLLNWNINTDSNAKFNKSTVKLAKRTPKEKLSIINKNQNKDIKVLAISIMNPTTSGAPSQGSSNFLTNTFSYWQYIDTLIYWGGSASEGIIVPPSADVTDSAHRNGVPVLGTIFFPPSVYGGKLEWVVQFLQKDTLERFPIADKLIQVALNYGFDGWFINQETSGTSSEHSKLMQEFIKYFKRTASNLQIIWYDAMTDDGYINWQNALTDKNKMFLIDSNGNSVADNLFLNFSWETNDLLFVSNLKAKELGLNPYNLFAGIDIQANGFNTPVSWNLIQRNGNDPFTSLGLYCPSWTYFSSKSSEEFEQKENRLWVNEYGDPSKATNAVNNQWPGISTYVIEKNSLTTIPFITNFSMGNGNYFYVNGKNISSQSWNNRSLQDIQPTYKWIIKNDEGNILNANIDYSIAYYGGNSIRFNGTLSPNKSSIIKLFSADLPLTNDLSFTTIAKANLPKINMDLILDFHTGETYVISPKNSLKNYWTTLIYDITPYVNKSIKTISYKISSVSYLENIILNLGNISIQSNTPITPVIINQLNIDDYSFKDSLFLDLILSWNSTDLFNNNIHHYEIYKLNNDQTKTFLGATPNTNFYIGNLKRNKYETTSIFQVTAINKIFKSDSFSNVIINWPPYPIPKASFKPSKTLIAPGEAVTLTNTSSEVAEAFQWIFEGANIGVSYETNPTVIFQKEGVYSITLKAKNISGENIDVKTNLITVSKLALNQISNLALGKNVIASSFTNDNEKPSFLVDGNIKTKWCATGQEPHYIIVDLGVNKTISEFIIKNAEVGGETKDYNTYSYTISLSIDGKNFTSIVNRIGNFSAISKEPIKVTVARYVKLTIDKATQGSDTASRIYEFEIYGLN